MLSFDPVNAKYIYKFAVNKGPFVLWGNCKYMQKKYIYKQQAMTFYFYDKRCNSRGYSRVPRGST